MFNFALCGAHVSLSLTIFFPDASFTVYIGPLWICISRTRCGHSELRREVSINSSRSGQGNRQGARNVQSGNRGMLCTSDVRASAVREKACDGRNLSGFDAGSCSDLRSRARGGSNRCRTSSGSRARGGRLSGAEELIEDVADNGQGLQRRKDSLKLARELGRDYASNSFDEPVDDVEQRHERRQLEEGQAVEKPIGSHVTGRGVGGEGRWCDRLRRRHRQDRSGTGEGDGREDGYREELHDRGGRDRVLAEGETRQECWCCGRSKH